MPCYVVCYDISDDRTRTQVGKRLLRHGERVQESVFEIQLPSAAALEQLRIDLRQQLDEEDKLHLYRLCLDCRKASQDADGGPLVTFPAVVII